MTNLLLAQTERKSMAFACPPSLLVGECIYSVVVAAAVAVLADEFQLLQPSNVD